MPYHVSLSSTPDQRQLYHVTVLDEFDRSTARALGEWIEAAQLNPEATFWLDFTQADHLALSALRTLRSRHGELLLDGRLTIVGVPARSERALTRA